VRASQAAPGLCRTVGAAALALAARTGGMAIDVFGFPVRDPADLIPRD
jgi:hypothetical protein